MLSKLFNANSVFDHKPKIYQIKDCAIDRQKNKRNVIDLPPSKVSSSAYNHKIIVTFILPRFILLLDSSYCVSIGNSFQGPHADVHYSAVFLDEQFIQYDVEYYYSKNSKCMPNKPKVNQLKIRCLWKAAVDRIQKCC